jgi:predicted acetyltransferase
MRASLDMGALVFGEGPRASDDRWAEQRVVYEPDRMFAVDDGDRIVGTGASYSFDVALPGGGQLPMAGVTWVGVLPTHRRRGILTSVMTAVIDQAIERGEPLAGLTASEATIYRRFGFGVSVQYKNTTIDTTRSAELVDVAAPGKVRFVTDDEAAVLFPRVWEQHWRRIPGELRRPEGWWASMAVDPEGDRDGASARYRVVYESPDGAPDGFAIYRMKEGAALSDDYAELRVVSIAAADDRVEAALLRFLLDVDLVHQLRWEDAPVDLALRWRLVDSRALRVTEERDFMWLCPLDVAACLAGRSYATSGGGVVEVVDAARPELGGRFRLDAAPDGAESARTRDEPDVVVQAPEFGSLLLGGVAWSTLHRAGLVHERTPGAIARFDTLFQSDRAPHCATDF